MAFRNPGDLVAEAVGKISTGEDVARSYLGGLFAEGAPQMLGLPGDMVEGAKGLAQKGVGFAERHGAAPKGTSEALAHLLTSGGAVPSPVDVTSRLGAALVSAGASKAGVPKAQAAAAGRLVPSPTRPPTTQDVVKATGAQRVEHKPQTVQGEYARTLGQFTPGFLLPAASLPMRAANVVVPAVTSETAGQLTKDNPELEPWARLAGAVVGSGIVGLANRPGPTTRMLAENSRGATDADIALAQALREDAAQRGITLTQAEALQQVTDNGTGLGRLQRVLEGTRGGNERLGPMMAERPGQVRQAVTDFADSLAPPTQDPYMLGQRSQEAAGEVLTGVRQQINANARPFYEALASERMPTASPGYQQLVQNPAYQEALGHVRSSPILNAEIAQLPDDSLAVVNEVVKHLDTLAENARPNPAASTGNAQLSAAYDAARNAADQLASQVSEPWRLSRAMVASGREAFLDPVQAGPLGAISKAPTVQGQTRALYPNAPPEGAAPATGQAVEMLPPDIGAGLTRQHLMDTFNEAGQNLQSGPNQWGGAKWWAQTQGNPEQAQTLRAGIGAAGGNVGEFDRLSQALAATGKRQAAGSQTAYNMEDLKTLGQAGAIGEGAKTVASGPSMFRRFGDALQAWQVERNAGQLAQALMAEPQRATEILLEARRTLPAGAALEEIERLAITAAQGRQELQNAP